VRGEVVRYKVVDGVATVTLDTLTLDCPDARNILNAELLQEQRQHPVAPGEGGQRVAHQGDAQGHDEVPLATQGVAEPPEDEGAQDLADQVNSGDGADRGREEPEGRPLVEHPRDGAGDSDLDAIHHPGDADRQHEPGVEGAHGSRPTRAGIRVRTDCRS
jgi:hypothetical protein